MLKKSLKLSIIFCFLLINLSSQQFRKTNVPDWAKNAVIYEVNIRQFTPEGTFKAFIKHLPRLKELGADILWLMPVHPVGEVNRKGSLGSYYSVKDFKKVNPEFGTDDDFRDLVKAAHSLGMYVILDWVANHTAWDNPWVKSNPDFYTKNEKGEFVPPVADWHDVIDLNYDNQTLRDSMISALVYWVKEFNTDGYRCDVAGMVPTDFWQEARPELDKIKPVFMLAEEEKPELHDGAFDMSYGWKSHHILNDIAKGKQTADSLIHQIKSDLKKFPPQAMLMRFITNHDENSWNGTEFERLGKAVDVFNVLNFTLPGMPLIYTGQEAGLNKRLRFFDKDTVDWSDLSASELFKSLGKLKKSNPALNAGEQGGETIFGAVSPSGKAMYFTRVKEDNVVLVILNFGGNTETLEIPGSMISDGMSLKLGEGVRNPESGRNLKAELKPYNYSVYSNR